MSDLLYAVPLIIAVSLVYAGTRHEKISHIWQHATRMAGMITLLMGIVFAVLLMLEWMVG